MLVDGHVGVPIHEIKDDSIMIRYNVQCFNGHVGLAPINSEIEKKCKERIDQGFLDALILHVDECPDCIEERKLRKNSSYDYDYDCSDW